MTSEYNEFMERSDPKIGELTLQEGEQFELSPEGWMTNHSLATEIHASYDTIKRITDDHRESHPEWFKLYKTKEGRLAEHFHPELVEILKKGRATIEYAPENWVTINALATELGVSSGTIKNIIGELPRLEEDWLKEYRIKDKRGNPSVYLHPDLVAEIRMRTPSRESAPEGWVTRNGLYKDYKQLTPLMVKKFVDKYRESNPEWFKNYAHAPKGYVVEHFHPELVAEIKEEMLRYEPGPPYGSSPEGWMETRNLAKELNFGEKALRSKLNRYRTSNPEWFRQYISHRSSRVTEHFHPDLVAKIREELGRK